VFTQLKTAIINGKTVLIKLNLPFEMVINRTGVPGGGPHRDVPRTLASLLEKLIEYFQHSSISKNDE
jgi:hypothetical protein